METFWKLKPEYRDLWYLAVPYARPHGLIALPSTDKEDIAYRSTREKFAKPRVSDKLLVADAFFAELLTTPTVYSFAPPKCCLSARDLGWVPRRRTAKSQMQGSKSKSQTCTSMSLSHLMRSCVRIRLSIRSVRVLPRTLMLTSEDSKATHIATEASFTTK